MTKDETMMLKGIAILMMLFLHLFSNPSFADITTPLLWVGDLPFATIFTRCCNPVGFFLVCSGYGLAYAHLKSRLFYGGQWKRVVKLYLNYWLILLIFVGVGSIWMPEYYPGSLEMVIDNMTGWNVDGYNHPAWFLLPYSMLSLSAPLVFHWVDKWGIKWSLTVSLAVSLISMYVISRYIAPRQLHHEWYSLVLAYLDLLFAFMVGGAMCYVQTRRGLSVDWLRRHQSWVPWLVMLWFAIHCLSGSAGLSPLFLCVFMLLYVHLDIIHWGRCILTELGRKSMVMWLIHAFLYGRFFHDFIYGFNYPILIFLVLVVWSYLLAVPIMYISDHTIGRIGWLRVRAKN